MPEAHHLDSSTLAQSLQVFALHPLYLCLDALSSNNSFYLAIFHYNAKPCLKVRERVHCCSATNSKGQIFRCQVQWRSSMECRQESLFGRLTLYYLALKASDGRKAADAHHDVIHTLLLIRTPKRNQKICCIRFQKT